MSALVSLILCTRNRAPSLARTLASVGRLAVPEGLRAELVVVDNGSTDDTAARVREAALPNMPVRLVSEPEAGLALARNAGLRAARGDVLLFTDDDVTLPERWLADLSAPLLSGRAGAVAGRIALAPGLLRPWMTPFHRVVLGSTELMRAPEPGVMFGASFGLARAVLADVPAFDPALGAGALGSGEETLFAWQLLTVGHRLVLAEGPPLLHHADPALLTRAAYLRAAESRGRSYAYIDYHWGHLPPARWGHPRLPSVRLSLIYYRLRLRAWRRRHPLPAEGIDRTEFGLVERIARLRQYLVECRRPRRYDRHGLRPREAPAPQAGTERRSASS